METAASAASVSKDSVHCNSDCIDCDDLIEQIFDALSMMEKYRLDTSTERLWANRAIQSLPSFESKIGAKKLRAVLTIFQSRIAQYEANKSQGGEAVALSVAAVQTLQQQAPAASLAVPAAVHSVQPATRFTKAIKQPTRQKLGPFRQFAFDYIKRIIDADNAADYADSIFPDHGPGVRPGRSGPEGPELSEVGPEEPALSVRWKNLTPQTLIDEYNKGSNVQLTTSIFTNSYITMKGLIKAVRGNDVELCGYSAGRPLYNSIQEYLDYVKCTAKEELIRHAAKWCIAEMRSMEQEPNYKPQHIKQRLVQKWNAEAEAHGKIGVWSVKLDSQFKNGIFSVSKLEDYGKFSQLKSHLSEGTQGGHGRNPRKRCRLPRTEGGDTPRVNSERVDGGGSDSASEIVIESESSHQHAQLEENGDDGGGGGDAEDDTRRKNEGSHPSVRGDSLPSLLAAAAATTAVAAGSGGSDVAAAAAAVASTTSSSSSAAAGELAARGADSGGGAAAAPAAATGSSATDVQQHRPNRERAAEVGGAGGGAVHGPPPAAAAAAAAAAATAAADGSDASAAAAASASAAGSPGSGRLSSVAGRSPDRFLDLSLCRLTVVRTRFWEAIQALLKRVEFRSPRRCIPFVPGMRLLFSLKAVERRKGRNELLGAAVLEIVTMPCAQAYARFPIEAGDCNLTSLCNKWASPTPFNALFWTPIV